MKERKLVIDFKINFDAKVKRKEHDGKEYLIAPVVLLTEGVHNGTLYKSEDLKASAHLWNSVPLTVNHPQDHNGQFVSARSPEIQESYWIGHLFNVKYKNKKLIGEAWIDIEKADNVDSTIVERLESDEPMMEVSTGLLVIALAESGRFNNETYTDVATDFRPDHLALLPNQTGACSNKDGCGIPRINLKILQSKREIRKKLKDAGIEVEDLFISNDTSHNELRKEISDKLKDTIDNDKYLWVVDVYSNHVIYEVEIQGESPKLFKQGYSFSEDEGVTLEDDKVEVEIETKYVEVSDETKTTINEGGNHMKLNKEERKKMIQEIIDSDKVIFCEKAREALEKMPDEGLSAIHNQAMEEVDTDDDKKKKNNKKVDTSKKKTKTNTDDPTDEEKDDEKKEGVTLDQISELMDKKFKENEDKVSEVVVNTMKKNKEDEEKGKLIAVLIKSPACKLSEESLESMNLSSIKELVKTLNPFDASAGGDMSAIATPIFNDEEDGEDEIQPAPKALTDDPNKKKE